MWHEFKRLIGSDEEGFGWFVAIIAFLMLMGILTTSFVYARDLGQWANTDPIIKKWFSELRRPDTGFTGSSCCGDADGYWCDAISTKEGGHVFCAITDDRDDGPLGRPHRPIGQTHEIPADKMKFSPTDPQANLGNPTGHSVIFLSTTGFVFCFVDNGGV
jgi:hypothetical protein